MAENDELFILRMQTALVVGKERMKFLSKKQEREIKNATDILKKKHKEEQKITLSSAFVKYNTLKKELFGVISDDVLLSKIRHTFFFDEDLNYAPSEGSSGIALLQSLDFGELFTKKITKATGSRICINYGEENQSILFDVEDINILNTLLNPFGLSVAFRADHFFVLGEIAKVKVFLKPLSSWESVIS